MTIATCGNPIPNPPTSVSLPKNGRLCLGFSTRLARSSNRRTADDAVLSLEGLARFRDAKGEFKAADNNLRDQRMGENLIWLANERYKNRRIIVWAAAFHT